MKCSWLFIAAALPLGASSIGVSGDSSIVLNTGDELMFQVSIQDYQNAASVYGAPLFPQSLEFQLVTELTASPATFVGGIESLSGNISEVFSADLSFQTASFDSDTYSGEVSTLASFLSFSSEESSSLFSGGSAVLYIEDLGGEVTLGLPPYNLQEDLYPSLAGGEISVGGITESVNYLEGAQSQVPEPNSAMLLAGGSIGLLLAAGLLNSRTAQRAARSLRF
jgi:hypothetical protein